MTTDLIAFASIDASGAQQGAAEFIGATKTVEKGADGITKSSEKAGKSVLSVSSGIERLQKTLDPLYAAQKKYESQTLTIQRALDRQAISQDRANELMKKAEVLHKQASSGASRMEQAISGARGKLDDMASSLSASAGPLSGLLNGLKSIGPVGLAAAAAIGAFVVVQIDAVKRFMESEQSIRRLDAALQATGNTTGYTRDQLGELADSLSKSLKIDDDDIRSAMATLTTFGSVSGQMFQGVIDSAADLSATFGGDLASNTDKIATMMNKLAGGSADGLRRAFAFLNAEQINLITSMAEGGRTYQAQEAFLKALQDRIGTQAEQDSGTLAGSVRGLSNAWDDLMKTMGTVGPIQATIDKMALLVRYVQTLKEGSGNAQIDALQERQSKIQSQLDRPGYMSQSTKNELTDEWNNNDLLLRRINLEKMQEERQKISEAQSKAAAAAAGIESNKRNELVQKIQQEASSKNDLAAAASRGSAALREYNIQLEVQKKITEAGAQATPELRQQIEALVRQTYDATAQYDKLSSSYSKTAQAADKLKNTQSAASKAADQYEKQQQEQAARSAQRQEELMMEPFKNAISGVQDAFTSAFENIFSGGVKTFGSLSSTIKGIFIKMVSQIASLSLFNGTGLASILSGATGAVAGTSAGSSSSNSLGGLSSILSSASNLLSGGVSSTMVGGLDQIGSYFGMGGVGPMANGGVVGGLSQYSTMTNGAFGGTLGAGIGGIGGSMLASSIFGSKGMGANIGGTIGAIAGSFIPVPILGPMIGSFVGTAIGGLFGNKKPTNAAAFGSLNFDAGTSTYSHMNKGNSAENMDILKQAFDGVLSFGQAFNKLGVGTISGSISGIDAGVRDRQTAYVNGVKVQADAGQFGQLAIASLKTLLGQTNITNSDVKTAIGKTDFSDLTKAMSDIQFAANFKDSLKAYEGSLTQENDIRKQAQESVGALNDQITTFIDTTSRLGLNLTAAKTATKSYVDSLVAGVDVGASLTEAEQAVKALRAQWDSMLPVLQAVGYSATQAAQLMEQGYQNNLARLRAGFNQSIQEQIQQISDPSGYALAQLDKEFETIRSNAATLGGDMVSIERLYGLKRQQVLEQTSNASLDALKRNAQTLQDWLDKQAIGSLSSLTPAQQLAEAQSQFGATLTSARGGDQTALSAITGKADSLLSVARQNYASSTDYVVIEQMVRSSLTSLGRTLGLPGFASGTGSAPRGFAVVGERGPELVHFKGGEQVIPSGRTASVLGQSAAPLVDEMRALRDDAARRDQANAKMMAEQTAEISSLRRDLSNVIAGQQSAGNRVRMR